MDNPRYTCWRESSILAIASHRRVVGAVRVHRVLSRRRSAGHALSHPRDPTWDDTRGSGSATRKAVRGTAGRTRSHFPDVFAEALWRSLLPNALGSLA